MTTQQIFLPNGSRLHWAGENVRPTREFGLQLRHISLSREVHEADGCHDHRDERYHRGRDRVDGAKRGLRQ